MAISTSPEVCDVVRQGEFFRPREHGRREVLRSQQLAEAALTDVTAGSQARESVFQRAEPPPEIMRIVTDLQSQVCQLQGVVKSLTSAGAACHGPQKVEAHSTPLTRRSTGSTMTPRTPPTTIAKGDDAWPNSTPQANGCNSHMSSSTVHSCSASPIGSGSCKVQGGSFLTLSRRNGQVVHAPTGDRGPSPCRPRATSMVGSVEETQDPGKPVMFARSSSEEALLSLYREKRGTAPEACVVTVAEETHDGPRHNVGSAQPRGAPLSARGARGEDAGPQARAGLSARGNLRVEDTGSEAAAGRLAHSDSTTSVWRMLRRRLMPPANRRKEHEPPGIQEGRRGSDTQGLSVFGVAREVRAHCLTFGGLAAAAVHAAIELRMCAEQSIDEHLCNAFSDLRHVGTDLQGTGLEVLVQSLPVIHFSVDQFENALLDVLKAPISHSDVMRLYGALDRGRDDLVSFQSVGELDERAARVCDASPNGDRPADPKARGPPGQVAVAQQQSAPWPVEQEHLGSPQKQTQRRRESSVESQNLLSVAARARGRVPSRRKKLSGSGSCRVQLEEARTSHRAQVEQPPNSHRAQPEEPRTLYPLQSLLCFAAEVQALQEQSAERVAPNCKLSDAHLQHERLDETSVGSPSSKHTLEALPERRTPPRSPISGHHHGRVRSLSPRASHSPPPSRSPAPVNLCSKAERPLLPLTTTTTTCFTPPAVTPGRSWIKPATCPPLSEVAVELVHPPEIGNKNDCVSPSNAPRGTNMEIPLLPLVGAFTSPLGHAAGPSRGKAASVGVPSSAPAEVWPQWDNESIPTATPVPYVSSPASARANAAPASETACRATSAHMPRASSTGSMVRQSHGDAGSARFATRASHPPPRTAPQPSQAWQPRVSLVLCPQAVCEARQSQAKPLNTSRPSLVTVQEPRPATVSKDVRSSSTSAIMKPSVVGSSGTQTLRSSKPRPVSPVSVHAETQPMTPVPVVRRH